MTKKQSGCFFWNTVYNDKCCWEWFEVTVVVEDQQERGPMTSQAAHCQRLSIWRPTQTRHRASTSTRWHFAFGAMLSLQRNPCTDYQSTQ